MITDLLDKAGHDTLARILSESGDNKLPSRKRPRVSVEEKLNEYNGWNVPSNGYTIPKVDASDLDPESFYHQYVRQRRPVIIKGLFKSITTSSSSSNDVPKHKESGLEQWKSFDYLKKKAGDEKVMVEKRPNQDESFGQGNEIPMSFAEFLDLISNGDVMHYLTTQDVEASADESNEEGIGGRPDLMAPLMKRLQDDFVLRPPIMANLIPSNINLWMGNSKDGSSSGLHHDYHDNLYLVLKGKKRFRLYSPSEAENMYTRGVLCKVHPNGRINYQGEETTAYGADLQSDAAANASFAKDQAEQLLVKAEKEVKEGLPGAKKRLREAEEAMDQALEALLDAEVNEEDEEFGDDDDDDDDYDDDDEEEDNIEGGLFGRRLVDRTIKNPNNFSKVEPNLLDNPQKLEETFPKMVNSKVAFGMVEEGDSLYLPASWFHEVTSSSNSGGGHMAMNYWFHPPDAINNYERPYTTDFWPNDFRQRFE